MKLTPLSLSIGNLYKVLKKLFLILSLEKRYRHNKQEILTAFSKNEWDSLSYEVKKRHSLTDCDGCMKNLVYRKTLAKFPVTDKRLQQKASKNGLYRDSVLADVTNLVVKKLDQTFKETFNEAFMQQLKPKTKQLKEMKRETAKIIKDDLQNKLKQRAVET